MPYFEDPCTNFNKSETHNMWQVSKNEVLSGPYFPVISPNTGKYVPEKNSVFRHFSRSDKLTEMLNCTEMHGLSHAFVSLSITFKFTFDIDNCNMHLLYITSLIRCFLKPFHPYVPSWFPWKHQEMKGILVFLGGSKVEIGKKRLKLLSVTWKSIFRIYTLELNFKNCS